MVCVDGESRSWPEGILQVVPRHLRLNFSKCRYLDKNYGSVFIIWDKMFGTFCEEDEAEKPIYGLTKPQNSLNVFYYQVCQDKIRYLSF